jgi:hypothetical protein
MRLRFLLPVLLLSPVLLVSACRSGTTGEVIDVVGERTGVLVWHRVARAEGYEVEILEGDDRVIERLRTSDTVAPLPPEFAPTAGSAWQVRALRDGRAIARSERQRIY